jgi:hypothetical protein
VHAGPKTPAVHVSHDEPVHEPLMLRTLEHKHNPLPERPSEQVPCPLHGEHAEPGHSAEQFGP